MFKFDLSQEPLSSREFQVELHRLKALRKDQIKRSCISDVLHAFVFIGLYFSQFLSGYSVLIAVAISTVFALVMAMISKEALVLTDKIVIAFIVAGAAVATTLILTITMKEELTGSLVAGLTTGSIVIVGATLGRQIKQVMILLDEMKPIIDDEPALHEIAQLCRRYPHFEVYRELAAQNLRPHLSYGELSAMREWDRREHGHQARSNGS